MEATLNVSNPILEGAMPLCRDSQANEMLRLIELHIDSKQGGSIYVSGVPGTGTIYRPVVLMQAITSEGQQIPMFSFFLSLRSDKRLQQQDYRLRIT